jgi:PAB-dependent poly(A)-specific ribonuclease subunit 3
LSSEAAFSAVEKWRRIQHPNIVTVREAFTTRGFGDSCTFPTPMCVDDGGLTDSIVAIVFVYDYHPNSVTLYEQHFSPKPPVMGRNGTYRPQNTQIDERTLWSYIVQIANAVKTVHQVGLAVRTIDASKIIVTGTNRIRINCCSILDVLHYGQDQGVLQLQQDDLYDFGRLVVTLACNSPNAVQNLPRSLDHISRAFSPDVRNLVLYLLSKSGPQKTIDEVLSMILPHVVEQLSASMKLVPHLCVFKDGDHLTELMDHVQLYGPAGGRADA